MTAKVITYGGIVTELLAPDRDGKMENVVLGFDNLKDYLAGHPFFDHGADRGDLWVAESGHAGERVASRAPDRWWHQCMVGW